MRDTKGSGSLSRHASSKMNIGLTGGLGCGKSTALQYFREAGAITVDVDALVHDMMREDRDLIEAVREAFGNDVIDAQGRVDRGRLAHMVFDNSEALGLLESLVHPRVRSAWMRMLGKNHPVLVVEIPLLFENELQDNFSLTICLSSDPEVQIRRLKAKGMNESQIQKRKLRQLSLDEKMRRADITIHNNGSLDHLKEQVNHLMSQFRANLTP